MPRNFHSPVPWSLPAESAKARMVLEEFINPSITGNPGKELPSKVLGEARGLVILTVTRFAFLGSVRFGSGVIVVRQEDGSWSPPSSVMTMGGGFGGQVGMELADFVFILKDEHAVQTFLETGTLMLSANFSVAFGPFGRSAEIAGAINTKYISSMYTFCKTRGLFGGISVEGGMLIGRNGSNKKVYGEKVNAAKLLNGEIAGRDQVESLMRVLAAAEFHPQPGDPLHRDRGIDGLEEGRVELPAGAPQNSPPAEIYSVPVPAPTPPVELHAESAQEQAAELPTESNETNPSQQSDQASQPEVTKSPKPLNRADISQKPQLSSPTYEAQINKGARSSLLADGSHFSPTATLPSSEMTASAH